MTAEYIYLIIFIWISYLISTDASVSKFILLLSQFIRIQYLKVKWWIRYGPTNPIVRYLMWRKSWKLAKELREEFSKNQDS